VKEFWSVFCESGVSTTIQDYEVNIDTGNNPACAVKKTHFGIHELPIIRDHIADLLQKKMIIQDVDSPWLSRPILAPKPHQEHITRLEDFIWRFCVNYVPLNAVTKPMAYPIPRCDDAVVYGFGLACFFALLDAYSGYHQIKLSLDASLKTTFAAPDGAKYRYLVMPFGLKNAPAIFVMIMHKLRSLWNEISLSKGIPIDDSNNTRIIIDDTFAFSESFTGLMVILRAIATVCRAYRLSLKLSKASFLPDVVEFVGVDVSVTGNMPATSKQVTLQNWSKPSTVRDIASFIGFTLFYSRWIPYFELRISGLRDLVRKYPMDHPVSEDDMTPAVMAELEDIRDAILRYPILRRADQRKRFYLKTDFSSNGMGWSLCQPGDDALAWQAMLDEDAGGPCKFELTVGGKLRLFPIAFGCRKCVGNEVHFHSHVGEATAAAYAMSKNRHLLWGRPFTLVTDCYALLWILNYQDDNAALRRLQLGLLGLWFTVAHRVSSLNADPDYWSRLGDEIHFDPLLYKYQTYCRIMEEKFAPSRSTIIGRDQLPGRRKRSASSIPTSVEVVDVDSGISPSDTDVLSGVNADGRTMENGVNPSDHMVEIGVNPIDSDVNSGVNPDLHTMEDGVNLSDTTVNSGVNPSLHVVNSGVSPFGTHENSGVNPGRRVVFKGVNPRHTAVQHGVSPILDWETVDKPTSAPNTTPADAMNNYINVDSDITFTQLSNVPLCFETSTIARDTTHTSSVEDGIGSVAWQLSRFSWVLYGFGSGHFFSFIRKESIGFHVPFAVDQSLLGRTMFSEVGKVSVILDSTDLDKLSISQQIHGYYITSPHVASLYEARQFLLSQIDIVDNLDSRHNLQVIVGQFHYPYCDADIKRFWAKIGKTWIGKLTHVKYNKYGDCIDDSCRLLVLFNSRVVTEAVRYTFPWILAPTTAPTPAPMIRYLYAPFNDRKYSITSLPVPDGTSFAYRRETEFPADSQSRTLGYLLPRDMDYSNTVGTRICDPGYLCPALGEVAPRTPFGQLFGIPFEVMDESPSDVVGTPPTGITNTYVRILSSFEYLRMYNLENNITYIYTQHLNSTGSFEPFYNGMPGCTSEYILSQLFTCLEDIRGKTSTYSDPEGETSLTNVATAVLSGVTSHPLPDEQKWKEALSHDAVCSKLMKMVINPSLCDKRDLMDQLPTCYRQPLRDGAIKLENGYLYLHESIQDSDQVLKLQIVPMGLWNVLFTAFHVNPIGGHLGVYYTLHKLRARYIWPGMYKYIKAMISKCAACIANNASQR
jgi:hypothetical protein